ncbi:peptidase domain-containing ABC transporter [Christiangramia marina]|uniref:peptidase domain-containing ABC transporter n=1 Tax=Christiangramia marina TaxID=409436 RepID=UPI003AA9874C
MDKFPHYKQPDAKDCGPTCLKIIGKFYGKNLSISELRKLSETTRGGSSLLSLSNTSEKLGFHSIAAKISLDSLKKAPLPCILFWNDNHYVVLYKYKKDKFFISDPAYGKISYSIEEFVKLWSTSNSKEGIALLLDPTPKFFNNSFAKEENKFGLRYFAHYLYRYKAFLVQLGVGLVVASILQVFVPFLTQSVVDVGIKNQDIDFIYLILIAQIVLFIGKSLIEIIRSWILLHLSTRINISFISDFFIKLMNLPISFFDSKMTGDILQRINDHKRIEQLLTNSTLNVLFSSVTFLVFTLVLAYYSAAIFGIFLIGSILYFGWIFLFLKKRKELDHKRFSINSEEQSTVIELINGMQEIKLHNAEKQKRWHWEHLQANIFRVSVNSLSLEQYQSVGSSLINELKNIIITIYAAKLVITGEITLGMMLAISYIVGQLNSPVQEFIGFVKQFQDAKISISRLAEIHSKEEEDDNAIGGFWIDKNTCLIIQNLKFKYPGSAAYVLNGINLVIPANKTTAIVGSSGSGKTTLMKMLLKFYESNEGEILIGENKLRNLSVKRWREHCGVVMQEGHIFNDTIEENIIMGSELVSYEKLRYSTKIACIDSFINELPLQYNTVIGNEGMNLSTGQKQRILIARAVYKDPDFIFFDEATSALDANNEKNIIENLNKFFQDRTAIIIAHRLSTVKSADQILVLEDGEIIEIGNHETLVANQGRYYNLVRNQLELGV